MDLVYLHAFIKWAHRHYDRVVLDSPPSGLISDAAVLAGMVTGVIVVCRPSLTSKASLRATASHLRDIGAKYEPDLVFLGLDVTDFRDDDAFQRETREARALGYRGKLCIHPRQVALANAGFLPSEAEVEHSRRLLEAYDSSLFPWRSPDAARSRRSVDPLVDRSQLGVAAPCARTASADLRARR